MTRTEEIAIATMIERRRTFKPFSLVNAMPPMSLAFNPNTQCVCS
ncbi:MAG: hypothetical protein ACRD8Z_26410 [Nitrososphaeraceae archaeon]